MHFFSFFYLHNVFWWYFSLSIERWIKAQREIEIKWWRLINFEYFLFLLGTSGFEEMSFNIFISEYFLPFVRTYLINGLFSFMRKSALTCLCLFICLLSDAFATCIVVVVTWLCICCLVNVDTRLYLHSLLVDAWLYLHSLLVDAWLYLHSLLVDARM